MKLNSIEDLFIVGLGHLYEAEEQLTQALPKMAKAASNEQLQQGFQQHLDETKRQVQRIEQVFKQLNKKPERQSNPVIKQMTAEAEQMIHNVPQGPLRDAALIVAGNQVEHYEIACYGALRSYAQSLNKTEIISLLEQSLHEEKQADQKLTQLAENVVNKEAAHLTAASAR